MDENELSIIKKTSYPRTNDDGKLVVSVQQLPCGQELVGDRKTLLHCGRDKKVPTDVEVNTCVNQINQSMPGFLTVMSFQPGLLGAESQLRSSIVALGGTNCNESSLTYFATPDGLDKKQKLSLSSQDLACGVNRGSSLTIYDPSAPDKNSITPSDSLLSLFG